GIAPTLIIIRVALGLSSTPSGRLGSGAASSSQLVHARVRIGHSKILYTDSGQPLAPEIPMPRIKLKNSGEDLPSSRSCVENAV
ncbi:hypothetical protein BJV78DRAFT_1271560, partial [Lactifluus subvellereus]